MSVPQKNVVTQRYGGTVAVPVKKKPILKPQPTENYVTTMERKQCEKHETLTRNYTKAKMKYLRFQKEIKKITQATVRAAAGPTWYQELSNKQMELLNGLDVYLKNDDDLGTATSSRRALKSLGVTMFIPKFVAMDALVTSQLDPVKFLTVIKDYVIQKTDATREEIKKRKKKFYSTEERILMSSILHLELPLLIKKLDYCLQDPVPDKKLEYIKLPETKRKPIKYASPYLEPLPEIEIPWTKMREIKQHNVNVKKQKIRENAKAKKKQERDEMALDFKEKITFKMKIKYPDHPLEKMFYDPPLTEKSELEENRQRSNKNGTNFASVGKDRHLRRLRGSFRVELNSGNVDGEKKVDDTSGRDSDETGAVGEESAAESEHAATSSRRKSKSVSFAEGPRETDSDDAMTRPYGWLFDEPPCVTWFVRSSSVQSSSSDEDDVNETLVVMDADGSDDDETDDVAIDDDDDAAGNDHGGSDDTDGDSRIHMYKMENDHGWLQNNDELRATIRMLRGGDRRRCLRERSATSSGTDVTRPPTRNIPRPLRTGLAENVRSNAEDDVTDDRSRSAAVQNVVEPSGERAQHAFNEDGTINLDAIFAEFRKLPPWKQLKAVLEFLAILGDPIAGFPDLIDVGKLRRWYERRLNMNKKVKSKGNIMMAKTVTAWNHMARSKLTDVPVPKNPVRVQNKDGSRVDWDQINHVKFKIKNTQTKYTTKLKHIAIDNARNTYPIMQDRLFNSRLNANFKHIFYDYFPAKEDDCLFGKTSLV